LQNIKPPQLKGYGFRTDSSGWACRRRWTDGDGKQRQAYVAHLSFETYKELRRKHRAPDALATALTDWIAEREREKGS
ncbi:MAG: hypothetical protein HOP19_04800, partial [Acidobacteria bacterium]|nr:hypothetical protein [Acidobacteriota bacterium]